MITRRDTRETETDDDQGNNYDLSVIYLDLITDQDHVIDTEVADTTGMTIVEIETETEIGEMWVSNILLQ